MSVYTRALRPLLFLGEPETMHEAALGAARLLARLAPARALVARATRVADPVLRAEVGGLRFDNPIGLAAGWDKSGVAVDGLAALGFGHVEVGSVSIDPSQGNPGPRLFRLPRDRAVVVHYGLPNDGARVVAARLKRRRTRVPVGVNVVKTNRGPGAPQEPPDAFLDEYVRAVRLLQPVADYLTLNLSCPNTENGRDFFCGDAAAIGALMRALAAAPVSVPLFLKISPLGGAPALDATLQAVADYRFVTGFIFNLAPGLGADLVTPPAQLEALPGSLAGRPVEARMNAAIRELYRRMDRRRYRVIGAGGVFGPADAYRKIRLGASLVQILTGLVYEGPGLVRRINAGLAERLRRDGFSSVADAVGVDALP